MKKKDYLKEFVDTNRAEFDIHEPPSFNFGDLTKNKKEAVNVKLVSLKTVLQIAAVAILFVGLAGTWIFQSVNKTSVEVAQKVEETSVAIPKLSEVSDEMAELENYYVQQVNIKYKEVEGLGVDDDVNKELKVLSEEFLALQKELGEGADNEMVLEEMVNNYQLKLDFLEQIINNMNSVKEKSPKNKKDENNYTIYY